MARVPIFGLLFLLSFVVLPAAPPLEWLLLKTPSLEIYSHAGANTARLASRTYSQAIQIFAQMFPTLGIGTRPVRVVVFASSNEFTPFSRNEYSDAYFRPGVDHDTVVLTYRDEALEMVALHEFTHLLMRRARLDLPLWLNEGLAELYATVQFGKDSIRVGVEIPGRRAEMKKRRWLPVEKLLALTNNSPEVHDRKTVVDLYYEGWALTHLLALDPRYRPQFPLLVQRLSKGVPAADALQSVYQRSVPQIDEELRRYLANDAAWQGVAWPGTADSEGESGVLEPAKDYDVQLMLAELQDHEGNDAKSERALQALIKADAERPEPHVLLGDLAWRQGNPRRAETEFRTAWKLGSTNGRILWELARMVEQRNPSEAKEILTRLCEVAPDHWNARLQLARIQAVDQEWLKVLSTLQPVKEVEPANAPELFSLLAESLHRAGRDAEALAAAKRWGTATDNPGVREQSAAFIQKIPVANPASPDQARWIERILVLQP